MQNHNKFVPRLPTKVVATHYS